MLPPLPVDGGLASLRRAFFRGWLRTHPEEATLLGMTSLGDRLRDPAPEARAEEAQFLASARERLDALDDAALTLDERLDRRIMTSLARFVERAHARGDYLANLEIAVVPCATLRHQALAARTKEAWITLARRAFGVPRFLSRHEQNLRAGIAAGRVPSRGVAAHIASHTTPALAESIAELPAIACASEAGVGDGELALLTAAAKAGRSAYLAHAAFLRSELAPRADGPVALGEDEVRDRLAHVYGLDPDPDALVAEAEAVLARTHEAMIPLAARIAPSVAGAPSHVRTMRDVRALLARLLEARLADPMREYAALVARARRFVTERGIFHVPEDVDVPLTKLPRGIADLGNATNWPAPLLCPGRRGHFAVAPDPAVHPRVAAALLAVHEAIPGHGLQSALWQRTFGDSEDPVRFLLVSDEIAAARGHWGMMVNIEGFATYVEELVRERGFYEPDEELYALSVRALRAARVIVDLELHTGRTSPEAAATRFAEAACVDRDTADRQVLRSARIPLQSMTYLVGALAIERAKADTRRALGPAFDEARFHDALLSFGPVPPAWLGEALVTRAR